MARQSRAETVEYSHQIYHRHAPFLNWCVWCKLVFKELLRRNKAYFISIYEICLFLSTDTKESPKDILCCLIGLELSSINKEVINLYKQDSKGNYQLTNIRLSRILGNNPAIFDLSEYKYKLNNIYINTNEFKNLSFIKDETELPPIHPKVITLSQNVRIEKKIREYLHRTSQDLMENTDIIINILEKKLILLLAENAKLNRQLSQSPNETIAELKQHNNELREFIDNKLYSIAIEIAEQAKENSEEIMQEFYSRINSPLSLEDTLDEINQRKSSDNKPLSDIAKYDISTQTSDPSQIDTSTNDIRESTYQLINAMKDLLLDPLITQSLFIDKDNQNAKQKPTQEMLAQHIESMNIRGLAKRNINGIFAEANKLKK